LQNLVELLRIPTFTNGQARGCLTSDHELYFSRTRYKLKESDIVVVVGTPLDFRLSFGQFGDGEVIHIMDSPPANHPLGVRLNTSLIGDLKHILTELSNHLPEQVKDHETWIDELRSEEDAIRQDEHAQMTAAFSAKPIHPIALYGELNKYLDKDAVVIGDGGDFVSWAGKLINSYQPGCWMDPGPYGCLGTGLGYATAARMAHPDRQVVLLAGDGAFGFSAIELDTLVRHKIAVVIIVGNNGIWGLEKHPMKMLYGYDVAADLQPECHYDKLGIALGGGGETISSLKEFGPAIKRAFSAKVPYVLNILLDPQVAYPRTSSLA
jgi:acetolactate synthase-1/2/3 large subunit